MKPDDEPKEEESDSDRAAFKRIWDDEGFADAIAQEDDDESE